MPSADSRVDAVIFDLGRVLVDYDWRPILAQAARLMGVTEDELKTHLFAGDLFHAFEYGRLSPQEFHAELARRVPRMPEFDAFCGLWNAIFTREIAPTLEYALRLRRTGRVRVAILSNTNALHVEYLRKRFAWVREWDHVYMSNEIGHRKPDAQSFHHVLDRLEVDASRAAFVDDMADNVDAAQELGFHAILAASPEAVRRGLDRLVG